MTQAQNPVVVRAVSAGLSGGSELLHWIVGSARPDGYPGQIVRMFSEDAGIEVYWAPPSGNMHEMHGRILLPWTHVRCVEEMMGHEAFAQELADAQEATEPGDDEGDSDGNQTAAGSPAQRQGAHA